MGLFEQPPIDTFWFWWDNLLPILSLGFMIAAYRRLRRSIAIHGDAHSKIDLALLVLKRCDRVILSSLELDVAAFECSPEGIARAVAQVRRYGREAAEDVMHILEKKPPPRARH